MDDIIFTCSLNTLLTHILQQLQHEFDINDLGDFHYFLRIEALPTSIGLLLHQAKFAHKIIQQAQMIDACGVSTSCTTGYPLSICDGETLFDPNHYRSIVGVLQYLTLTHPNIAYVMNTACQYMHVPTTTHWTFVKCILRFLTYPLRYGIQLTKSSTLQFHAYSNVSWAGDYDDYCSIGGLCIFFGSNLIS